MCAWAGINCLRHQNHGKAAKASKVACREIGPLKTIMPHPPLVWDGVRHLCSTKHHEDSATTPTQLMPYPSSSLLGPPRCGPAQGVSIPRDLSHMQTLALPGDHSIKRLREGTRGPSGYLHAVWGDRHCFVLASRPSSPAWSLSTAPHGQPSSSSLSLPVTKGHAPPAWRVSVSTHSLWRPQRSCSPDSSPFCYLDLTVPCWGGVTVPL
jgi:hypothetical protein